MNMQKIGSDASLNWLQIKPNSLKPDIQSLVESKNSNSPHRDYIINYKKTHFCM